MSDLEPRPCDLCGKVVMQRHPAFECAWVLRERVRELEALLADALTQHVEDTEGHDEPPPKRRGCWKRVSDERARELFALRRSQGR